ncbi:putative RNA-directed DNA polymerase from transposon X-element [Trichonephila inaurata madagascariensis]|uniref:Putative RNA-directed DNA polymerase from transposon X-element n=1 Tax=Trichonephila inaurata madagascariensis TaxID=2747483 RepID=A0A8X6J7B4_9ARAC|nr:putative RNA-directed DNA polymerase from transposon X-element [Trichonephila inaurata madagascariensis]
MASAEDFPPLNEPSAPDETALSMETDSIPTEEEKDATCAKLVDLRDFQLLHEARLRHHREVQQMIITGVMRGNNTALDNLTQEIEKTSASLEEVAGELARIGTCPKINCQMHPIVNVDLKVNSKTATQLESQLEKLNVSKNNNDKPKKSDRSDGFTTPTKAAKKQKVLQNYSIGANAPVNTANKFQPLASTTLTQDNVAMPVAPPKMPPIHLRYQKNFNLIMQEINRRYPKSNSKLSGEFLKIFASSAEEHRAITNFLTEKGQREGRRVLPPYYELSLMDLSCFGLRIASWNANGVRSRTVEMRDFIDKHRPDIFLIQETHLGPGDSLQIPNFTTYRNDRPHTPNCSPRGGTAILLKSSLPHHHTPTPPMGTLEATSVTLTPPGGTPLLISSIYISPSFPYQHINTDLEALFSLGGASILCGDFNAHHTSWGCRRVDYRGTIIKNLLDSTDTQIIAPQTPTRFGNTSASIIDFALTRNLHWHCQVESIAELSSDHNPILISFDTNARFAFPKRHTSTDWAAFRDHLSPAHFSFHPITARTGEDVETQVADLTNKILFTHALSSKPVNARYSSYVSTEIRELIVERNRARKIWQFTRNPSDKRVLNNIHNRLRRKIKSFQNKIWEDDLRSLDPDDGSLWERSKELRKKKTPVYALNGPAGIANTDSDKAEVLACSLESQFQNNDISHSSDFLTNRIVENYFLNENNFDAPPLPPPMPSEIIEYIKKSKGTFQIPGNLPLSSPF